MKSHVSMEQHVCPVCGKTHDTGAILLDRRLRQTFDRFTVTDYELCPEHAKLHADGFVALVECSNGPTSLRDARRTGNIAHVRRRGVAADLRRARTTRPVLLLRGRHDREAASHPHRGSIMKATRIIVAALVAASLPATAALQARDVNGDSVVDAYFDDAQNLTWLRDADAPGLLSAPASFAWVVALDVYGVTGWRLPGGAPTACTFEYCTLQSNELRTLATELGDTAGPFVNTGGSFYLYTSAPHPWAYGTFSSGSLGTLSRQNTFPMSAWAVHDGDILSPVPEPETWALLVAGLVAVVARRRSR